jgi:hypothetical protein
MKVGDVIRIPSGAVGAFKLASDIGIVVGTLPRKDDLPDDFEIMVDGFIHAMGSQLACTAEVINESR